MHSPVSDFTVPKTWTPISSISSKQNIYYDLIANGELKMVTRQAGPERRIFRVERASNGSKTRFLFTELSPNQIVRKLDVTQNILYYDAPKHSRQKDSVTRGATQ